MRILGFCILAVALLAAFLLNADSDFSRGLSILFVGWLIIATIAFVSEATVNTADRYFKK